MGLGAAFLGGVVSVGLALGWRWNMSCSALAGGGASVRGGLTMRGTIEAVAFVCEVRSVSLLRRSTRTSSFVQPVREVAHIP